MVLLFGRNKMQVSYKCLPPVYLNGQDCMDVSISTYSLEATGFLVATSQIKL